MPPLRGEVRCCKSRRVGVRREEKKEKKTCDLEMERGLCHDGCARMAGHGNKKNILVSGGGVRTGVHLFFGPGFSSPDVSLCPFLSVLRCYWSTTRIVYRSAASKSWSYSRIPKRELLYRWIYGC